LDRRTRCSNFSAHAIAQIERHIAPATTMSLLRAKDTVSLNKDSRREKKRRLRFHLVLATPPQQALPPREQQQHRHRMRRRVRSMRRLSLRTLPADRAQRRGQ